MKIMEILVKEAVILDLESINWFGIERRTPRAMSIPVGTTFCFPASGGRLHDESTRSHQCQMSGMYL